MAADGSLSLASKTSAFHIQSTPVTRVRAARLRAHVLEQVAACRQRNDDEHIIDVAIAAIIAMVGSVSVARFATWFDIAVQEGRHALTRLSSGRLLLTLPDAPGSDAWIEALAHAIGDELLAWLDDDLEMRLARTYPEAREMLARKTASHLLIPEGVLAAAVVRDVFFPFELEDGETTLESLKCCDEQLRASIEGVMPTIEGHATRAMIFDRAANMSSNPAAVKRAIRHVITTSMVAA